MSGTTLVLILSLVAGVAGTGLGGIVGVIVKGRGSTVMGRILSFAGGVMVGIVAFEMAPEAVAMSAVAGVEKSGVLIGVASIVVGMLVIYALNKAIDMLENMRETHRHLAELHHETAILAAAEGNKTLSNKMNKRSLIKAGIIMLCAIALHNFPEGMAIGATGTVETKMGVMIAIIIAVHNVPEGMAIAAPLAGGGMKSWKVVGLTVLAGAATVLGAVFGILVGGIGDIATGVCMGLAGGSMLYVTFCEIIPQATLMEEGRMPAVSMLIGIIFSMFFVYLF